MTVKYVDCTLSPECNGGTVRLYDPSGTKIAESVLMYPPYQACQAGFYIDNPVSGLYRLTVEGTECGGDFSQQFSVMNGHS